MGGEADWPPAGIVHSADTANHDPAAPLKRRSPLLRAGRGLEWRAVPSLFDAWADVHDGPCSPLRAVCMSCPQRSPWALVFPGGCLAAFRIIDAVHFARGTRSWRRFDFDEGGRMQVA